MKKTIFLTFTAALIAIAVLPASAQIERNVPGNPYRYTYPNGNTIQINWKPESAKSVQRYTVAVNPTVLANNGLKFDFEMELPRPGNWLQIGVAGYYSPPRNTPRHDNYYDFWWRYYEDPYDSYLPASSWDSFRKMSGGGVSILYKRMLHRRGWYLSTGLAFNYFHVEYTDWGYVPFKEDGLTFYRRGEYPVTQSFFKPTAEFNVGKHFAISHRCFIDLYAGMRLSYSLYKRRSDDYQKFDTMYGFAYRGIDIFHGGVRFGVLLWDKQ
jgi:hypothetical protein